MEYGVLEKVMESQDLIWFLLVGFMVLEVMQIQMYSKEFVDGFENCYFNMQERMWNVLVGCVVCYQKDVFEGFFVGFYFQFCYLVNKGFC